MPDVDLKDYVHISQYEQLQASYDAALDEIEAANKEREEHGKFKASAEKSAARLAELEAKLRTRTHRDAAEKVFEESRVKKHLRDDMYRLSEWKADADEVDEKALRKHFAEVLERRPWAIDQEAAGDKPAKKRLDTEEPAGRGPAVSDKPGRFKVTRQQIRDPKWMRHNQDRYAEAIRSDSLDLVD